MAKKQVRLDIKRGLNNKKKQASLSKFHSLKTACFCNANLSPTLLASRVEEFRLFRLYMCLPFQAKLLRTFIYIQPLEMQTH